MDSKQVRSIMEAYNAVYAPQEVKQLDENVQDAVKGALEKGAKFMQTNPVGKVIGEIIGRGPVGKGRKTPTKGSGGYRPEEVETDLYNIILEYLVAEGYADTNEAALAIMGNMSEGWRESILSEDPVQDYRDMKRADQNRAGARGPEFSHDTKPGLKGKPQPGSSNIQKPGARSREFTNPPS